MLAGADVSAAADNIRLTGVPMAAADTLIAALEAVRTSDLSFVGDTGAAYTSAQNTKVSDRKVYAV